MQPVPTDLSAWPGGLALAALTLAYLADPLLRWLTRTRLISYIPHDKETTTP